MKKITICDKEYPIEGNAFTSVEYKNIFKTGILKDMHIIQSYIIKQTVVANQLEEKNISKIEKINQLSEYMIPDIDEFITKVTQIAWILIYTANNRIEEYKDWLKSIDKIKTDDKWIAEVTEFAVDCFC